MIHIKRHIQYTGLILVLMILSGGCTEDYLSIKPKTSHMENNYYQTEDQAFNAMVAVYDALHVQNWQFVPIMADIWSDDAFCGGSTPDDMYQYQIIESNSMNGDGEATSALWNRCYSGIYRANKYLQKEKEVDWSSEDKRNRMMAEVKFLRAYFYWDLARHWGRVPIITEVYSEVEKYKNAEQATTAEVYSQVATDLVEAIPELPEFVPATEKGRITRHAAKTLLARVYMLYNDFVMDVMGVTENLTGAGTPIDEQYAINALEDVITSQNYRLLDNYSDVFRWDNENNDEVVFAWQYSDLWHGDDWGGWGINGNFAATFYGIRNPEGDPTIQDGYSFSTPTWSLVNEFEAGDPRLGVSIYNAEDSLDDYTRAFQNTGYFFYKYMPRTQYRVDQGQPKHNWPINYKDMRFADVLLMAAELYVNGEGVENQGKADQYLNRVRTRALGQSASLSGVTMDDIRHERRVELAGEGQRKWDLMRWGSGLDYARQMIDASFDDVPADRKADFAPRYLNVDTWGMFPIPNSEIRNTNQGVLQNFIPAYQNL
jgi:hypothetical protein